MMSDDVVQGTGASGDLTRLSAGDMARGVATGDFTARQLVEAHLRQIEECNPQVRAFPEVLADPALATADAADAMVRSGQRLGPLHGVPFSVKQNIDVADSATTWGVPALQTNIAAQDAPVVRLIKAAGAIPIARSNMPDFALRFHTDSSAFGATRNPRWPAITPGGSSGGDAAGVAAFMAPIGIGNDLGGSIRNPAFACGVAGIRPTVGVVPEDATTIPDVPNLALRLMNVHGPIARTVADLELVLGVVGKPSHQDPRSVPRPLWDRPPRNRVAVIDADLAGDLSAEVVAALEEAVRRLRAQGLAVDVVSPPHWDDSRAGWKSLVASALAPTADLLRALVGPDAERFAAVYEGAGLPQTAGLLTLMDDRMRWRKAWAVQLAPYDALIAPVWRTNPFGVGADLQDPEATVELVSPVLAASFLDLPAVSVPCAPAGAHAHGVQVIGHRFEEHLALSVAGVIERDS